MIPRKRLQVLSALVIGGLFTGAVVAEERTAEQGPPAPAVTGQNSAEQGTPGVWKEQKYQFNFMGFTTTYSCNGLEDKLGLLLRMTGAAPGFKVQSPCARGIGRPDKLVMAYLTFSSLQPDASAGAANSGTNGVWRHVQLAPHRPFDFDTGDCELIEEFRDKVLPLFATRNLENRVTCVPHQDSGSYFSLAYDVFAPVKPARKH